MVCLHLRQNPSSRCQIIRHRHKLHIRTFFAHGFHCIQPVLPPEKKLRVTRVLSAPDIDNAQIFAGVIHTVILRFHFEPLPDFISVFSKIGRILHIPIQERRAVKCQKRIVNTCYITAVFNIMTRISDKNPVLLFMISFSKAFLFHLETAVNVHKIHTIQYFPVQYAEIITFGMCERPCRHIAEQLVSKSLTF